MRLSKQDIIELLEKAQELVDTVISELPEDDNLDNPLVYLYNIGGDIQEAINLISDEDYPV